MDVLRAGRPGRADPRLSPPGRARRAACYLGAFAIGLWLVGSVFPRWALTGALPPGAPPRPDFGKDVIGQLYFFSQAWNAGTWNPGTWDPGALLIDRRLEVPWGASIALTDSIPLLTMLSKLLRPVLPPFEQTISLYQAAAWLLQPVAALFALRSAGERRWLPGVAVALMAACMPTFLFRLWHAALDGHAFILAMLGLSLRITAGSRPAPACACLLQAAPGASVDRGAGSATTAPPVAEWTVGVSPQDFEAVIPAGWIRERGAVVIELRTSPLVSTLQLGRTTDPRRFGIFLLSVAFSPAPAGLSGR